MYTGIHIMNSLFLLEFNEKIFFDGCLKNTQISEFMKLHPAGVELFHEGRRKDMKKLGVAFRNSANATKNITDYKRPNNHVPVVLKS
jgi:hypothetical protein